MRSPSEFVSQILRRYARPSGVGFAVYAIIAGALTALAGSAISEQDKYAVQVPDGLAFSEFRGYEDWQTVQTADAIEVILANPVMIDAYRAGVPEGGKHFADGLKMAKIHWKVKKSAEAPAPTTVPDTLYDVDFMIRDSKRFPNTGAWGYAQFDYDSASDTFKPGVSGTDCGHASHTIVAKKDYVFTTYGKRWMWPTAQRPPPEIASLIEKIMTNGRSDPPHISRRVVLAGTTLAIGAAAASTVSPAAAEIGQADAKYQPTPKDGRCCRGCYNFQPLGRASSSRATSAP